MRSRGRTVARLFSIVAATAAASVMSVPGARADGNVGPLSVSSKAVIYAAGQPDSSYSAGAGGVNPVSILLGSDPASVTFPSVTGSVSCNVSIGTPYYGPDGGLCGDNGRTKVGPANSLSQIQGDTQLPLVGVFLADGAPAGATPAGTDFTGDRDFSTASPLLQQVFFIGDGRESDGTLQTFNVPPGATTLWLGLADSASVNGGTPSHYDDNGGSFSVSASVAAGPPPALPEAPVTGLLLVVGLVVGTAAFTVRRRRARF